MLRWAVIFLIIALLAGVFGFWQLEGTAMWIAEVLALVFLVLFVVSLVNHWWVEKRTGRTGEGRGNTPRPFLFAP